jgi:hypothetical protein
MSGFKQTAYDHAYFTPLASLQSKVYAYTAGTGSGGAAAAGSFAAAGWAALGLTKAGATPGDAFSGNPYLSSLVIGGLLKDMGKTVVSSGRTFRKVQAVLPRPGATLGVAGQSGTTPVEDYLTGYIELGFEGSGNPAPVARMG